MKKTINILLSLAFAVCLTSTVQAKRGSDGQLNLLYWQAPSTMNPNLSGGTKELEAASVVIEPLARYDHNGNLVPYLAVEIPTVANGGVAEDFQGDGVGGAFVFAAVGKGDQGAAQLHQGIDDVGIASDDQVQQHRDAGDADGSGQGVAFDHVAYFVG